ncbi:MAG TPA: tetraacyldisaccharide 4'-kinase [Ramlibacter sp.]|nr:tetraacyldisaccharide 4'-kinase [Ramlibacter sp.]
MTAAALRRAWERRGLLACLLLPLAWLYGAIAAMRRAAYQCGLARAERVPVPVVVVGNVLAGGAGKTPVVTALVQHLQAAGLRVGVVSRGYGRRSAQCAEVTASSQAHEVGDEPLLIARVTGAPVFVAARRIAAARALLRTYPATQVIVSDDGLQHLALARDIEVCVFDERGAGNGWLLPAGPLREPWPRPVDLLLRPPGDVPGVQGGFWMARQLATHAVRADGTKKPLAELGATPVAALAGIARPEAFFAMLRSAGLRIAHAAPLADHHDFDARPADIPAGMPLLCTEKDAVKLWPHDPMAWAVPLQVDIDPAFWTALQRLLHGATALSSTDGSQTA